MSSSGVDGTVGVVGQRKETGDVCVCVSVQIFQPSLSSPNAFTILKHTKLVVN